MKNIISNQISSSIDPIFYYFAYITFLLGTIVQLVYIVYLYIFHEVKFENISGFIIGFVATYFFYKLLKSFRSMVVKDGKIVLRNSFRVTDIRVVDELVNIKPVFFTMYKLIFSDNKTYLINIPFSILLGNMNASSSEIVFIIIRKIRELSSQH